MSRFNFAARGQKKTPGSADSGHDISLQWSGWSFSTPPLALPYTPITKAPLAFRAKLGEQMERGSEKAILESNRWAWCPTCATALSCILDSHNSIFKETQTLSLSYFRKSRWGLLPLRFFFSLVLQCITVPIWVNVLPMNLLPDLIHFWLHISICW